MKRFLTVAVLFLLAACNGSESLQFAPPSFVSVESEVTGRGAVTLSCTLSSGRVERCGFLYGEDGELDQRRECSIEDNSFCLSVSGLLDEVDYTWCAFVAAGGVEILSDKGTFRISKPEPKPEPIVDYPPDNELWYTTLSGGILEVSNNFCPGLILLSNTYKNGLGVLRFDFPVSTFAEWALWYNSDVESLIVPSSVKVTSYSCFRENMNLKRVVFAPGLIVLGDSSLHHNEGLQEVLLPDTCISIEKDALSHAYSLETVELPPYLESLGQSAFLYCTALRGIVLPSTIKSIGIYAFENDVKLESVTCLAPIPPKGGEEMFDNTSECPIYVPAASVDAYRSAPIWRNYAHRIRAIKE